MAAETNGVNLTDGLDGLAAGAAAAAFAGMALALAPAAPGLALFCAAFSGASAGFLAVNSHPARRVCVHTRARARAPTTRASQ